MFVLKPTAKEQLDLHFGDKDKEPIRVYMASGCGGPRLGLALDAQKDGDEVLTVDGYTFLMEQALFEEAKPVAVTFDPQMGFAIESSIKFPEHKGGCSSCGCGGSCG